MPLQSPDTAKGPSHTDPASDHNEPDGDDNDDDPVTAEYDVYITAPLASSSLYLLQFPTREREHPYNAETANAPLELRIKPKSGFIEVDVPISHSFNFDTNKAKQWGEALSKAKTEGAQGYGMAAGFSNPPVMRAQPSARGAANRRKHGQTVSDDADRGQEPELVMEAQTLGGQIIEDEKGRPNYMIGAFRGAELHLTPVNGIVQMRPEFHHIDAKGLVDRNSLRRSRETSGDAPAPRIAEPRLVQIIARNLNTTDADSVDNQTESTKIHLLKAMEEKWTRLKWLDEETDDAYQAWHEMMFHNDTARAPKLHASMTDDTYLDAISAPKLDPSGKHVLRPMHKKGKATTSVTTKGRDEENEDEDGGTAEEDPDEEGQAAQEASGDEEAR